MSKITALLRLMRPYQWYKNLVIFIGLFLGGNLLNISQDYSIIIGFAALCLISSFNYVVNDIVDAKADAGHPEKSKRPLPSKEVAVSEATILAAFLLVSGISVAYFLSPVFAIIALTLAALTLLYTLKLKKEPFLDVIMIGTNFVLRAVSGAVIINVEISPWLIICTFFAALFMAFGKRRADIGVLGKNAEKHNVVFKVYTKELLDAMLIAVTTVLVISYSLYTFFKGKVWLIVTIPFALYFLLRYFYLIRESSKAARHPHLLYKDCRIVLCALLWCVSFLLIYYFT